MASASAGLVLDDAELSLFLSEMDGSWVLQATPPASGRNTKKPRRSRRLDLLNTREELEELEQQLQIQQEMLEFREALLTSRTHYGLSWKLFALREMMLKKAAIQEQSHLQIRVDTKTRQTQRISRLIHRQPIESMPKSVQIEHRIVDLENVAHVFRVLRVCLDSRAKGQWRTFALRDCSVSVEFYESVAIPFGESFVRSGVATNPSLNAIETFVNHYVDETTQQRVPVHAISPNSTAHAGATASDRRLILRRRVQVGDITVVLWEDAFCWQSNAEAIPTSVLVRGNGWAMIAPFVGHANELSVVHSGGFIQINAKDRSHLKTTDSVVNEIVEYTHSLQRSRIATLEAILISAMEEDRIAA